MTIIPYSFIVRRQVRSEYVPIAARLRDEIQVVGLGRMKPRG
jgi:hypothetical protein